MKHVLSLLAYLLNRKFDRLPLFKVEDHRWMLKGASFVRKQLLVSRHFRRAIPIVVASIDRTSSITMQPCSLATEGYQVRQRIGTVLKINVVPFAHRTLPAYEA